MSSFEDANDLPPLLGVAAHLSAKNTEYNLDLTGRVTNLNERGLITSFNVEIPVGTVLFSIIDLRQINASVRGLIRVTSQSEAGELGGFRTVAEFVDLNPDERRKILRLLGRSPEEEHAGAHADAGSPSQGTIPAGTRQARAPRRPGAPLHVTLASVIWIVLAIIFYSMVLLAVVAIFPQGRAAELAMWAKILHWVKLNWPSIGHFFGLK